MMNVIGESPNERDFIEEMGHEICIANGPPWGFRISGGAEIYRPIIVSRVTPGSPAAKAGLKSGDVIVRLNGILLKELERHQVEEMIVNAEDALRLIVSSTDLQIQHGNPTAADPTWVALAQKMEKPRRIGEEAKEGGLVTIGKGFGEDKHPVHVFNNSTPSVFEARRTARAVPMTPTGVPNTNVPGLKVTPPEGSTPQVPGLIVCQDCKKPIMGEYKTVSGLNFHPQCFHCGAPNCQGRLDKGFIVEGDRPYCVDCHDKYFAKPCARCGRAIVGQVYHALNHQWHLDCFKCCRCQQPFLDGIFYMEEGKLYCDADYKRLFSADCDACGAAIGPGDKMIKVGPRQWHHTCFKCQRCKHNLHGKKFQRRNGLPMCHNCASF